MGNNYSEDGLIIFYLARNARVNAKLQELMELVSNVGITLILGSMKAKRLSCEALF